MSAVAASRVRGSGSPIIELCKAVLSLPLQYGGVTDDFELTIAIEVRDAPIERGNEVSQPSVQIFDGVSKRVQ
jgi:hypothetical protein